MNTTKDGRGYKLRQGYRNVITSVVGIIERGEFTRVRLVPPPWDWITIRVRIDALTCGHWVRHSSSFGVPGRAYSRKCPACLKEGHVKTSDSSV